MKFLRSTALSALLLAALPAWAVDPFSADPFQVTGGDPDLVVRTATESARW